MEIYTIENLTFTYPKESEPALKNVGLTVNEGDYLVVLGRSGCGKTTLLRRLKPCLAPAGRLTGKLLYRGEPLEALGNREAASRIGFVAQDFESAAVTDKVWHELAFGLESLGVGTPEIRRRVAETAAFFGIGDLFYKKIAELSGGQKQLVNLASVTVMRPDTLILDEPTAQLDPVAASSFLNAVKKLNRELGTTVILADHRLEEALPDATLAAVMESGEITAFGTPPAVAETLKQTGGEMFAAMPAAARVWGGLNAMPPCPLSVPGGREFVRERAALRAPAPVTPAPAREFSGEPVIEADDVWLRYEKNGADVLKGFSLSAYAGELLCVMGENGCGKSTALRALRGLSRPYRGKVTAKGKVVMLPQDPRTLFVKRTVYDDLLEVAGGESAAEKIAGALSVCRLGSAAYRHPYDLSGGEAQRAALAEALLLEPDILLLDEPTKGMDAGFKTEFAGILGRLRSRGVCVIAVSHDTEFCAACADRCALFFDGCFVCEEPTREFFLGNRHYTTGAAHIAEGLIPNAVTVNDIVTSLGGRAEKPEPEPADTPPLSPPPKKPEAERLPPWRKICAGAAGVSALFVMLFAAKNENLPEMAGPGGVTPAGWRQLALYGIFSLLLIAAVALTAKKPRKNPDGIIDSKVKLSPKTVISLVIALLAAPATLFAGIKFLGRGRYPAVALAVLLESMLPFFLVLEGKRPRARKLVTVAALCALAVAGRAVFFMLPQFKPVLAVTVIAGVALGGEAGFLVGSVSMLVSNILFSQGPWTPWQMFATGIIGFLAGLARGLGLLRRSRAALSVFGAASAVFIYGGIMNFSSALIWQPESLNKSVLITYYVTGFPMDCVYGAATALFLWALSDPLLEKLDRVKLKWGETDP